MKVKRKEPHAIPWSFLQNTHNVHGPVEERMKSPTDPCFQIGKLELPKHLIDSFTWEQIEQTKRMHKRVDEEFIGKRIEPRYVVFMEEGAERD